MTDSKNVCREGGYLVGGDRWLPTEAVDYFGASFGLFVGCNRLVCTRCHAPVRQAVGYAEVPSVAPAALHADPAWRPPGGPGRLYSCRCHAVVVHGLTPLAPADPTAYEDPPPWRCAGHPALALPRELDGVALARPTDWRAVAAAQLGVVQPLHPTVAALPGFFLTRVWRALDDADDRDRLGRAVGACAGAAAPEVRQGVALFFALNPRAAGLEGLLAAWQADPPRYDALPAPWGPQPALRGVVLEAISCRLGAAAAPDPTALAALRWAATHAPGLGNYFYRIPYVDGPWAAAHVDELMAAGPADWEKAVRAIAVVDPRRLVPGCRAAIAAGHATREGVRVVLEQTYGRGVGTTVEL